MITCQAYDFVEIACLLRLKVRLHMHDGNSIEGIALDTARTDDDQEALLLERNEDPVKIALATIEQLEALTVNPHFSKVDISIA